MEDYLDPSSIRRTRDLLDYPELRQIIVEHNFAKAARHFSYKILRQRLGQVMHGIDLPWDDQNPDSEPAASKLVYLHNGFQDGKLRPANRKRFA